MKLIKFQKIKKNLHFSWNKFCYANYMSNMGDICKFCQKKMSDSSQLTFSLTLIATEPLDQIMATLTDIMVTMEAVRTWRFFCMKFKVHIFWEGHKILQNLHLTFVLLPVKSKVKISQIYVAFSEYTNFMYI